MVGSGSGGFVGRESERALLRRLVADLAAGRGRAVLVEGEPGIGKSALLAEGLSGAGELGCEVLWGVADELGQRFPLQVMVECLGIQARSADPRRAEIARLLRGDLPAAGVSGPGAGDPVVAAVERLLALVDELSARSPAVLVVDDLQWADEASLLVFHRLTRTAEQVPLLLVGACRPVPRREGLEQLRRGLRTRDAVVLSLGPLRPPEVEQLLGLLAGALAGPGLRRRAERAAGNPLYVREMVDALRREEAVRIEAGVADIVRRDGGAGTAATSLSAAIADRLGFLPRESREVLRAAALLGAEFSVTDLGLVTGRPVGELVAVVEDAVAAGVVESSGALLRFRHGMIRQALYEAMPPAVRSALHRQAAQALADAGAPLERVAQQLLPVAETQDAWMLGWLARSVPALTYRAPQIAAELLQRAIEHASADDPRLDHLESSLVRVTFLLARHDQIDRHARRVLARTRDPELAAEMAWMLAYTLMRTGGHSEGRAVTAEALQRPALSAVWTARLRALHSVIMVTAGEFALAEATARQALAEAELAGDRAGIGFALHGLSVLGAKVKTTEALRFIERALTVLGEDEKVSDLRMILLANRALYEGHLGQMAKAEAALRQARTLAERTGAAARLGMIQVNAAEIYFRLGRWDDAQAELESVADLPETEWLPLVRHGVAALIAGHRDDRATVEAQLRAVEHRNIFSGSARTNSALLLMARALAAERDGRPSQALALLAHALQPDYAPFVAEDRCCLMRDIVRLGLAVGDQIVIRVAAESAAADAERDPVPSRQAASDHCRGLLDTDPVRLLAAVDSYRRVGWPLGLAQALEDAAVLLARAGNANAARAAHAEAIELYTELGADWDIVRADARVRPFGIRRGPRGPRTRATSGWDALSPTEVKVAHLVAGGQSNPEIGAELFLSRRTVQTHVSHIMAKLGVHSRSEVAREAGVHPAGGGDRAAAVGKIS